MTSLHTIEVWLVALAVTISVIGGFTVFARWCSHSSAIPRSHLEQLRVGMTCAEIISLIGQPREVRQSSEGRRQWVYGARMKRHVLLMEFDSHDHLLVFAHGVPGANRRPIPGATHEP